MADLKVDQFVEEEICDKDIVKLSLGDVLRASCDCWRKPWPTYATVTSYNRLHNIT